jgi:hypothetical protein
MIILDQYPPTAHGYIYKKTRYIWTIFLPCKPFLDREQGVGCARGCIMSLCHLSSSIFKFHRLVREVRVRALFAEQEQEPNQSKTHAQRQAQISHIRNPVGQTHSPIANPAPTPTTRPPLTRSMYTHPFLTQAQNSTRSYQAQSSPEPRLSSQQVAT